MNYEFSDDDYCWLTSLSILWAREFGPRSATGLLESGASSVSESLSILDGSGFDSTSDTFTLGIGTTGALVTPNTL